MHTPIVIKKGPSSMMQLLQGSSLKEDYCKFTIDLITCLILIFILVFNLVPCVLKVLSWSLML